MNILITGGEGFVGRNLAEHFTINKYPVLCPRQDELDLVDTEAVDGYFKRHSIDTIIHCATTLRDGTAYPTNTCENNLRMFFNLQRQLTSSMKLINLGSGSEYSRKYWHRKMPEDYFDKQVPDDSHSYAKYLISKSISDSRDDNCISLRIFGIFGKYEDYRYKFISNSIAKYLLKMPIVINQNVIYDYLYIQDFSRIIELLINKRTGSRIFNTTPTDSIDLLSIANIINQLGSHKSEIQILNKGIGVEYTGCNQRLLSELGGFKFMSYQDSISALYVYYKKNLHMLNESELRKDAFLDYAKELKNKYFINKNEEQHN